MKRFSLGLGIFVGYAMFLYLILYDWDMGPLDGSGIDLVAVTILFCLGLGFLAQISFDWDFSRPYRQVIIRAALAIAVFAVILIVQKMETLICVAIAAPIVVPLVCLGVWILRRAMSLLVTPPVFSLGFLALPILLNFGGIAPPPVEQQFSVSTTVIVNAPIAALRRYVEDIPAIQNDERVWTITHNLMRAPRPIAAETHMDIRSAQWTKGVRFEEHILPSDAPNILSWRFHFPDLDAMKALDYRVSPIGPEVIMNKGGYKFIALSPTQTQVTLTTEYTLNTPLNGYLAAWGRLILNDMHRAVLHVLVIRGEKGWVG